MIQHQEYACSDTLTCHLSLFREIRQDDGAGWRGGEVPGKVCFSCGQDDKDNFRGKKNKYHLLLLYYIAGSVVRALYTLSHFNFTTTL